MPVAIIIRDYWTFWSTQRFTGDKTAGLRNVLLRLFYNWNSYCVVRRCDYIQLLYNTIQITIINASGSTRYGLIISYECLCNFNSCERSNQMLVSLLVNAKRLLTLAPPSEICINVNAKFTVIESVSNCFGDA